MRTAELAASVLLTGCTILLLDAAVAGESVELRVDPAGSQVSIGVGKAGVFGFAGHAHEVSAPAVRGTVSLDAGDWSRSAVSLDFQAAALRVTGKGEPPGDVPEVQRVMLGPRVLDAERFPAVSFRSTRVVLQRMNGDEADLRIEGNLTLHGVTRPIVVPVHAALAPGGALTASGRFSIAQTAYGIQPVTAAGGSVRVRDEVDVQFAVKAHR